MSNKNLDIFDILGNIDKKNIDYYKNLSDDDKKKFQPYPIMRWLSGNKNKLQLILLNEFVNPYIFNIKNKDLLYYLFVVSNTSKGKKQFYKYPKRIKNNNDNLKLDIISKYYNISKNKASHYIDLLLNDDIIKMAEEIGFEDKILNKLK